MCVASGLHSSVQMCMSCSVCMCAAVCVCQLRVNVALGEQAYVVQ